MKKKPTGMAERQADRRGVQRLPRSVVGRQGARHQPDGESAAAGVLDTMAISWAAYGVEVGIHRLMDGFARHGAKASVMTNAVIAERSPATVKAIADNGHEVLSHSYAMDVIPALLVRRGRAKNIERCTALLQKASGKRVVGWLSPRGTSKPATPRLLAEAGYRWYGDVFDTDLPYVASHGNKRIVAIPLSYDVNDMPSMKYGHPPRMMLDSTTRWSRSRAPATMSFASSTSPAMRTFSATIAALIFMRRSSTQAMSSPDIWVGTRAEIADHVLSMASARIFVKGKAVASKLLAVLSSSAKADDPVVFERGGQRSRAKSSPALLGAPPSRGMTRKG